MSEPSLRIISLEAQNVKRLRAVHITPTANVCVIGGRNAQGKSSVLDAIAMAFSGLPCERPINAGESSAEIQIDVGEFKLRKRYTASGNTLTITGSDGAKWSSPQKMLDKLIGDIAFDPLEFSRMKPPQQLEVLRDLVGVNTSIIDQSHATAYEERTAANRKVGEITAQLAKMPHHPDAPEEEVSLAVLSEKLAAARRTNAAARKLEEGLHDHQRDVENSKAERARWNSEVGRLQAELTKAYAELDKWTADATECEQRLSKAKEEFAVAPRADEEFLLSEMSNITTINRQVQENTLRADAVEALEQWATKAQELSTKLETLAERKRQKIADAKYPVPGLRLGHNGVIFNDVPFAQSSAAEKLRVSVAMGLAMNPRLKVILIRDGSLLDEDSMATIEEMAIAADAQIFIERVGEGEECSIVIEDGHVKESRQ